MTEAETDRALADAVAPETADEAAAVAWTLILLRLARRHTAIHCFIFMFVMINWHIVNIQDGVMA